MASYPDTLPLSVKLCYGTGSLAKTIQGLLISVYLLYFYTDALGISPGLAGNIVFWGRIWDLLNDPIVGAAIDRTRAPGGACRIFLNRFSVPAGILLALCFAVPDLSDGLTILWVVAAYLIQAWTSTLIQIPLNTLMGRLTPDKKQRAQLNQAGLIFSLAGNYLVTSYTIPLLNALGEGNLRRGYLYLGVLFGFVYTLCCLIVLVGTRGYETCESVAYSNDSERPKHPLLYLATLLQNRIWLCIIAFYVPYIVATVLESSAMVYYYQYVLHNPGLLSHYSAVSTACSCVIYVGLPIFIKYFGNSKVLGIGCCFYIAGHLFRFFLNDSAYLILTVGWIISSLGLSLVASTIILNVFDARVYGEWKTGVRHDALLMSGFTVSSTIGMAFGSALVGWLLELVPYVEGVAQQVPAVEQMLFYMNTLIPAAAVGISLLFSVPIICNERKLPLMRREIENRLK